MGEDSYRNLIPNHDKNYEREKLNVKLCHVQKTIPSTTLRMRNLFSRAKPGVANRDFTVKF